MYRTCPSSVSAVPGTVGDGALGLAQLDCGSLRSVYRRAHPGNLWRITVTAAVPEPTCQDDLVPALDER